MKNHSLKRFAVLFVACLIAFSLTACYTVKTTQKSDYATFRNEMLNKNNFIYQILPALNSEENIDDIYLYYSDKDLLDSFYTIYLNCVYSEEQYTTEHERLLNLFDEESSLQNVSSFDYDSIVFYNYLEFNSENMICIDCAYVLLDEENSRIVYVMIFQKVNYSTITNIPEEFLPKECLPQIKGKS